jgi:F0F1-type ATP synthase membrane subunit c/vacuolar-type H+-ATPase subunit K
MLNFFAEHPALLHYTGLGLTLAITTIGVALGQSRISSATSNALYTQPTAAKEISKLSIMSMAFCETALFLTLTIIFGSLFNNEQITLSMSIGSLLLILCMGIVAATGGYLSSYPAQGALEAICRQPFFSGNINILMLITTLFIQTPVLFGFLLSISIAANAPLAHGLELTPLIAAAIAFGIGCVGPLIGLAQYGYEACKSIGLKRHLYKNVFSFTILCQAMIEAPIIFVTVLSFLLLGTSTNGTLVRAVALSTAGIVMAIGTLIPGIVSGKLTTRAIKHMVANPEQLAEISRASFIAQVFIDTLPLHCLILSLILLFLT